VQHLHRHYPAVHLLVLSLEDASLYARRAVHAGADAVVQKCRAEAIVAAVRKELSKLQAPGDRLLSGANPAACRPPATGVTRRRGEGRRLVPHGE
jgi:DNA-binding NarL/FixJ family response regulator